MKLIFLDIDGVLNSLGSIEQQRTVHTLNNGMIGLDPELVQRFNRLVTDTGAGVVLSSSWRLSRTWRLDLFRAGLKMNILDATPKIPGVVRGVEIDAWLKAHKEPERYAIIDDDSDMLPWHGIHFFQTNYAEGLTEEVAKKVADHLLFKDNLDIL